MSSFVLFSILRNLFYLIFNPRWIPRSHFPGTIELPGDDTADCFCLYGVLPPWESTN